LALIDEVTRYDRPFAWVYVNKTSRFIDFNPRSQLNRPHEMTSGPCCAPLARADKVIE